MRDGALLVARCVRGLEGQTADEILTRRLGSIVEVGHRAVHFRAARPGPSAVALRTADDVFLLAARGPDTGAATAGLDALAALAARTDAGGLLRRRQRLARAPSPVGVEVSASFLGRRNFNRYAAEDAVGRALADELGLPYHSRRDGATPPPGCVAWRLTLDGTRATLLLRVADRPLHRRAYKRATVPGTLHPPLAAAMARTAEIGAGHTVLDPCCGAGTLLIEAALVQPQARCLGYDAADAAVAAARANAAGVPGVRVRRADAGALPLADGGVDRVVCNPPWGGQVAARGLLSGRTDRWWRELARVLAPDGAAVVLVPGTRVLAEAIGAGLDPVHVQRVRVAGAPSHVIRLTPRHVDRPAPRRPGRG